MKVLIIDDEVAIQQIISFMLESQFQASSVIVSSGNQAVQILERERNFDCILCDFNMSDGSGSEVHRYLVANKLRIPFILCSTYLPDSLTYFKTNPPDGYVQKPDLFPALYDLLVKMKIAQPMAPSDEYCRIRTELILKLGLLNFDLFVQVNPNKYIHAFRKDDLFEIGDFERFQEKKIGYFHIKSSEATRVLDMMMKNMSRLVDAGNLTRDQALDLSTSSLEFISGFNKAFGLSKEVQELTHATVRMVVKTIQTDERLAKLYSHLFVDQDNYLVSHSIVLSYFCCGLASLMGWTSEITFYILTLASFFHDISLETDALSRIQTLEELQGANPPFSMEEMHRFKNHPELNAKLIDELADAPAYVSTIILQHHELPTGKGFPAGLDGSKIHPLAAIFIIAEELVTLTDRKKSKVDLMAYLQERANYYGKEPFRKIVDTMEKSLRS